MSRTMNNLKESFSTMKAITTTTILNDNSMSRYTVGMLLKKAINFLLTSIAWSLRENIRPSSFMYGPRPASSVRTVKTSG